MYRIALKMLVEDKAKYIGMILSLSFSAVILTQQAAIFIGLMKRTYGNITDTPQADIWVMDPNVKYIDDITPLRDTDLFRVRSVPGVEWAVPFFKGTIRARQPETGKFQTCVYIGVDSATFIGAPHTMLEGRVEDLRQPDAIIVNVVGAQDKLAYDQGPGEPKIPLQVGDVIELNYRRAKVVGICDVIRSFQSNPVIYTTYTQAIANTPFEERLLSFILVKSDGRMSAHGLCEKITRETGFSAYTKEEFKSKTIDYYMRYTGIPINFGIAVLLGLLVGAAIAGQIFYNFTTDNLKYSALFSIMGASRGLLARMTLLQATWLGIIGWGIGSGASALLGYLARNSELSYNLPWWLFLGIGLTMMLICYGASLISIRRIFNIELATIFKQ